MGDMETGQGHHEVKEGQGYIVVTQWLQLSPDLPRILVVPASRLSQDT